MIQISAASTTGISTTKISASRGLVITAKIKLPISSSGTRTITRSSIITASVTWVTSLVRRVISPPVSSRSRLPNDSDCTLRNSGRADRPRSSGRPARVNTPQPIPPASPTSATPSIHSPVLITTPCRIAHTLVEICSISRGCTDPS